MAKRKKKTGKTTDNRTLEDKHKCKFFDDDFHAAEDAVAANAKATDVAAANITDKDKDKGMKKPKDMELSATMHRRNMERRIRKNQVKSPPQKILDAIDEAISLGEHEKAIRLCNSGHWASKWQPPQPAGGATRQQLKDYKEAVKADMAAHPEKYQHDDVDPDPEQTERLMELMKKQTL